MKQQVKTVEDKEALSNWKGAMKGMYDGLQQQNDLEEMALEHNEMMGEAMPKAKARKGFFSKMSDSMSSAMH